MNYKYMYTTQAVADIEIDNIGDTCLLSNDDAGTEWYLYIHTSLGWTTVFEYGPCYPDLEQLPVAVACSYQRFEFSEKRISKLIDNFLNNPCRRISQAREVTVDEIKPYIRDLREVLV